MKNSLFVFILLFSFFSVSCQQRGVRSYTAPTDPTSEVPVQSLSVASSPSSLPSSSAASLPSSSVSSLALQWDVPSKWHAKEASSMRLASYDTHEKEGNVDFSVVKLSGAAGGLQSNLDRWAVQVGVDTTRTPIKTADIKGRLEYKMAYIQGSLQSILIAIFEHEQESWFFKAIGPKEAVSVVKPEFEAWVQSVRKRS